SGDGGSSGGEAVGSADGDVEGSDEGDGSGSVVGSSSGSLSSGSLSSGEVVVGELLSPWSPSCPSGSPSSSPQWSKVPRSRWGTSPGGHTSSWSSGSPSWRVPSALGSSSVVACEGAVGSPSRPSASAGAVARGTVTAMAAE